MRMQLIAREGRHSFLRKAKRNKDMLLKSYNGTLVRYQKSKRRQLEISGHQCKGAFIHA